jgi:hypothetical protein
MRLVQAYLNTVTKLIPVPESIEAVWRRAEPGREAVAVNELLRAR